MTPILTTARLLLREATADDAGFFLELLNQPGWLQYIGDRNIHSETAARDYVQERLVSQYRTYGFGLWVMILLDSRIPVGICGLVKRDFMDDPDLGYALLDRYQGQGLVREASLGVLAHAFGHLGLPRLAALTDQRNMRSQQVLNNLGFTNQGILRQDDGGESVYYLLEASA